MFSFRWWRKKAWPSLPLEDIRRRARVLVIDDSGFTYKALFRRDGYNIDSWRDVIDLAKLEERYYDVILLDIQGVGAKQSADEGFGVLRHVKKKSPTQMVVAYSNADWSLKFRRFFDEADAVLPKSADYVDFKRTVDELLQRRFSLEFFVDHIDRLLPPNDHRPRLRKAAESALLRGEASPFASMLRREQLDEATLNTILQITQAGIGVLQLLLAP